MSKYLLGIDIGTSGCKATIFDLCGRVQATAKKSYKTYYPKPSYVEQDPQEWYQALCDALQILFKSQINKQDICGIGIAGQSWSAIAIGQEGNVISKNPIWLDSRAQDICEDLVQVISPETLFQFSGNPLSPYYTTPKILWYKKHQSFIYDQTQQFLQSNSYIVYRLTKQFSNDYSQGYGLYFFDLKHGKYNEEVANTLGIDFKKIPPLFACHEIVGYVTPEAARETGLMVGTPVVAGGLDAACAALGVGVIENGQTQEQGGQAGGMSICCDEYLTNPQLICGYHVIPNKWLLQGGTVGGSSALRWFKEIFNQETSGQEESSIYDKLLEPCSFLPAGNHGVIFLPYLQGERSPLWNPKAKGLFYGLSFQTKKAHFTRAILEGVAYALRDNLECAYQSGAQIKELRAMGGAANSQLWTQIKADVTKLPVLVPTSEEATTLGAAILAGVGVGVLPSYFEAVQKMVVMQRYHQPNPQNYVIYDENFVKYQQIYKNLKEVMKK